MEDLNCPIRQAIASPDVLQRHRAFGEIVHRFQDMAYGCAYAALRDSQLAEDAAQEAFLTVWQRLHELREPAAFPGWLQRIVRIGIDASCGGVGRNCNSPV